MSCQHCQQAPISRPRRLCWVCYYTPEVRDLYPSTSKFGRRGHGNCFRNAPVPTSSTHALPGTPEKMAVLEERARLRQNLWHPDDADFTWPLAMLSQVGECSATPYLSGCR